MGKLYKDYPMSSWYSCNQVALDKLKQVKDVKILVVHADWCPDCEYTLPNLKSVMQHLPNIELSEVEVNFRKKDPHGIAEKYQVKRIPTFVVLQNGKEVGKIVEYPQTTIEDDIVKFLGL